MDQLSRNVFSLYPSTQNYPVSQQPFTSNSNTVNADSPLVDVLRGNGEPVVCMAISENGIIIVSGCADGRALVWRTDIADSIRLYCDLVGHQNYIRDVLIFYPQVLTASGDGTVKKWHLPTKQLVQTWRGHDGPITNMTLLGGSVYTASLDETVILWDYNNGTPLVRFRGHAGPVGCLALIPAEPSSQTTVRPGNMADFLVTGSADTTVRLWNISNGQMIQVLGYFLAQNNENNNTGNATAGVLQPLADNSFHRGSITALAFVRSAQILCSGSSDFTIRGWAAPTWICVIVLDTHSAPITHLQAPNEDVLYSAGADGAVHAWNFEMQIVGRERQVVPVAHLMTTFSPFDERSSRIFKNNYQEPIYGMSHGSLPNKLPIGHPRNPGSYFGVLNDERQPVETVTAFCKVGRFLVVGSMDGTVCCYDDLGAIVRRLNGHTGAVTSCKSLLDRFVLTSSVDGTIRIWNKHLLFVQPQQPPLAADVLPVSININKIPPVPPMFADFSPTPRKPMLNYYPSLPPNNSFTLPPVRDNIPIIRNGKNRNNNVKYPVVIVDDDSDEDDSGTELSDLRTIATQTKKPATIAVGKKEIDAEKKKKPQERVITIYREKTPETREEDQDEEREIVLVPKKSERNPKLGRKMAPPGGSAPTQPPHQPQQTAAPPQFDATYFATRDHQRELALMSMAAEVAVERALRRAQNVSQSLDTPTGRLSLPPILPDQSDKHSESRAWSLPSARHRLPELVHNFNNDDDDEYFQELDYAPSHVVARK